MADYIPEQQSTPPNGITLLDIAKVFNSQTGQEFSTRFTNINDLLSTEIRPLFINIEGSPYTNEQLGDILVELSNKTLVNSREIIYLHRLVALLIFELIEQGIEPDNKELIIELKKYIK